MSRIKQLPRWVSLVVVGLGGVLLGAWLLSCWQSDKYLAQPLFVEIINLRPEVVPNLTIEHGNDNLQEKIIVTQLQPEEVRVIMLNHRPGLGFSVKTKLDGQEIDVCVGKSSNKWINQIFLRKDGIASRD